MNREQAIDIIKNLPIYRMEKEYDSKSDLMQALEMAIADMEKQISKKPILNKPVINELWSEKSKLCPNCHNFVSKYGDYWCSRCGQRLEWEDE